MFSFGHLIPALASLRTEKGQPLKSKSSFLFNFIKTFSTSYSVFSLLLTSTIRNSECFQFLSRSRVLFVGEFIIGFHPSRLRCQLPLVGEVFITVHPLSSLVTPLITAAFSLALFVVIC